MIPRHLFPALLLFLLTACSGTAAGGRVQETPQNGAQSRIAASPEITQFYASTETRPATATPNAAGTLAVLSLQATEKTRLENREMLDRTATMQALANQYTREAQPPAPQGVDAQPFTGSFFAAICPFCGAGTTLEPDTHQIRPHATPVIGAPCSASGLVISKAERIAENLPTKDDF